MVGCTKVVSMAGQWEYKRGIDLDHEQMNDLGGRGWELVNIFEAPIVVRESDERGRTFPPHATPPDTPATTIVSFWKRPVSGTAPS
jgi:hypothetical protein